MLGLYEKIVITTVVSFHMEIKHAFIVEALAARTQQ